MKVWGNKSAQPVMAREKEMMQTLKCDVTIVSKIANAHNLP